MARSDDLEFQELLDLARDKSLEGRTRLTQIVGDLYFDSDTILSDRERALMSDILRQLIHDVELTVRRRLAERFATEADAPRELISTLANDEIAVAYPILTGSPVLQDIDLIEIIWHRTRQHRLAIAHRPSISEQVSDALVETGEADVIRVLLENHSAEISRATMDYLVEESQRVNEFQNPLLQRHEMTAAMANRMYWWVSAALREYIVENFDLDATELEESIQDTVTGILSERAGAGTPPTKSADLAQKLSLSNAISPKLLADTLRKGAVRLFEDLFAELTHLDAALVRRMIYQPGGELLAVACRAVDIDKADFASIFLLSRGARPGDRTVDPDELPRVLDLYDRITPDAAKRTVRRWRLDPEFQQALDRLVRKPPGSGAD